MRFVFGFKYLSGVLGFVGGSKGSSVGLGAKEEERTRREKGGVSGGVIRSPWCPTRTTSLKRPRFRRVLLEGL